MDIFSIILTLLGVQLVHGLTHHKQLPVVIWHGMGDTCCDNQTMGAIRQIIADELPNTYVHSVRVGSTEGADRTAGFFGNVNTQLDSVCTDLLSIPELRGGVNLMGFSQGGLFARALVQRCSALKVQTLVTWGAPHSGVSQIPSCAQHDTMCNWMRRMASRGVYSWYVRDHVVQAQYFKDPNRLDEYLERNVFLPDINGDSRDQPLEYRERIVALEKMVLVRFSNDSMICPAGSSWFGFVDENGGEIGVEDTRMYREDWLGLRELNESGRLELVQVEGTHMQISERDLRSMVSKHFALRAPLLHVQ
ncbi:hypothetical protein GGF48_003449 [Coemansia sp. RSA 921]|nr:hypothetical protein GGF48_003449 [Coemansia sp. RSA 921]KAJ2178755.1 hypothetical protein GGF45_002709 [Coemansia sp. RSA 551]KAJ2548734.1 hypothetical protein IWW35_004060 [Coemansia sp. RSA 1878]